MGGDIVGDLVGIATGHVYFILKDIVPIKYDVNVLKTPEFLITLIDRPKPTFMPSVVNNNSKVTTQFVPLNEFGRSASYRDEGTNNNNEERKDENENEHRGNRFAPMSEEPNWGD